MTESEEDKEYCGFVCSDVVEKAKEIRKELDDFAKYNPEEANVVLGNVLNALRVTRYDVTLTPSEEDVKREYDSFEVVDPKENADC